MRALIITAILTIASSAQADEEPRSLAFAVTVSGALGWVDMGQFSSASASYFDQLERGVDGFERRGATGSHLAASAGLRAQLRLPRLVTLEAGIELMTHRRATPISIGASDGEISYRNTSLALPFAVGLHVPVLARVAIFGSLGPTLILASRSDWRYSLGEVSSFVGDVGGGFEVAAGAEVELAWRLHAVLGLRYRFAKSGELRADGPELPPLQPVEELGWKGLDAELGVRLVF